jgi:lysophospholipase L1-like esterase
MTHPIRCYVALGDSLSEGVSDWGHGHTSIGFATLLADRLRVASPDLRFANLGVGGAKAADVLRDQLPNALAQKPDLVTLVGGANDVPVTGADEFARDYRTLVQQLCTGVGGVIAIATIPGFSHLLPASYAGYRALVDARISEFNRVIAEAARECNALLVDLQHRAETQDPRNISRDGVHPNARGYRIMARAFIDVLNTAGLHLAAPPVDFPDLQASRSPHIT